MLKRILLYVFPIYIVGAEVFVRHVLLKSPAEEGRIGPSVAVAGISLLLPVLIPRRETVTLASGSTITIVVDYGLVQTAWIFLVGLAGLWVYCLYLSNQVKPPYWAVFPVPMVIGVGTYITGVVFTELKEWL